MDKYYALLKKNTVIYALRVENIDKIPEEMVEKHVNGMFNIITKQKKDARTFDLAEITKKYYDSQVEVSHSLFEDTKIDGVRYHVKISYYEIRRPFRTWIKRQLFYIGMAIPMGIYFFSTFTSNSKLITISSLYFLIATIYSILIATSVVGVEEGNTYKFISRHSKFACFTPFCLGYGMFVIFNYHRNNWGWMQGFYSFMLSTSQYIKEIE